MLHILSLLKSRSQKVCVFKDKNELILLSPDTLYYCESVDEKVFIYCKNDIYQSTFNLSKLENTYSSIGFLRISKSMVINLHKIKKIKKL